jgi:hypothetical protein
MATDLVVRTYDPKQIVVTFGPVIMSGFADGTFVQVTRSGDLFSKQKGADGSIDRVNNNTFDFTVAITLKQTSPSNEALSAIVIADQLANAGILPLVIKDLRGSTLFVAPQAWIAKDPDDSFASDLSSREWRFDTGPAEKFTGSNN